MAETWRVSPWLSEVDSPASPLLGEVDADVVIVGAGYTGLSAALELRKAGLSVVLLESEVAGFGASGRNAGHLTPTIGKDLPTLARLFGREQTQALVRLVETAVCFTEELIREHGIEGWAPAMSSLRTRSRSSMPRASKASFRWASRMQGSRPSSSASGVVRRAFPASP